MNCQVIKIKTPKKYLLDALYFGPLKADRLFIFIHGLGGNLFSKIDLFESLVDKKTAVLAFNNRGHGAINRISREDKRTARGYVNHTMGFSHEIFSDCVDDLEGAVNFAFKTKAKSIFLIGHSTGCQKTVYYLAKKQKSPVQGAILLAPMSDYASMVFNTKGTLYKKLITIALKMVLDKRGKELMPSHLWSVPIDAQRFLSLYDPGSEEEIFSYASSKKPIILQKAKKPLLVILAGKEEFKDRSISKIAAWFKSAINSNKSEVEIIPGASHGFTGFDKDINKLINNWLKSNNLK